MDHEKKGYWGEWGGNMFPVASYSPRGFGGQRVASSTVSFFFCISVLNWTLNPSKHVSIESVTFEQTSQNSESWSIFKRRIKTHLFRVAFILHILIIIYVIFFSHYTSPNVYQRASLNLLNNLFLYKAL